MSNTVTLNLAIQIAGEKHTPPVSRATLRRWALKTLAVIAQDAQLTVRLVGLKEGRQLNRDFRGKDYATNVLTFAYAPAAKGLPLMADIVICSPVIAKEAKEQGKTLKAHFAHMLLHGILHAAGFDHETAKDAKKMEALEIELLAGLRIANPYEL